MVKSRGPDFTYLKPLPKQGGNHAVALKGYSKDSQSLTLTLIDSLADGGERTLKEGFYKPRE